MDILGKQECARRYAQLEGERDYHKRRSDMLERQRDALARDLRYIVDCQRGPLYLHEMYLLVDMARETLRRIG